MFADVTPRMKIARDEVFGPFTVVLPFDDEAEEIRIANDSPYGLAAAIRTRDVARAHRVAAAICCGTVWVNDHHRSIRRSPGAG